MRLLLFTPLFIIAGTHLSSAQFLNERDVEHFQRFDARDVASVEEAWLEERQRFEAFGVDEIMVRENPYERRSQGDPFDADLTRRSPFPGLGRKLLMIGPIDSWSVSDKCKCLPSWEKLGKDVTKSDGVQQLNGLRFALENCMKALLDACRSTARYSQSESLAEYQDASNPGWAPLNDPWFQQCYNHLWKDIFRASNFSFSKRAADGEALYAATHVKPKGHGEWDHVSRGDNCWAFLRRQWWSNNPALKSSAVQGGPQIPRPAGPPTNANLGPRLRN